MADSSKIAEDDGVDVAMGLEPEAPEGVGMGAAGHDGVLDAAVAQVDAGGAKMPTLGRVDHLGGHKEPLALASPLPLAPSPGPGGVVNVGAMPRGAASNLALMPRVNFGNFNMMMGRPYSAGAALMANATMVAGKRKRGGSKMGLGSDDQRPCPGMVILPVDNLDDMAFVLLVNDLRQNYDARYHSRIGLADNAHGLYMNKAGEKIAELVTRPPALDLFLGDHVTKKRGRKTPKGKAAAAAAAAEAEAAAANAKAGSVPPYGTMEAEAAGVNAKAGSVPPYGTMVPGSEAPGGGAGGNAGGMGLGLGVGVGVGVDVGVGDGVGNASAAPSDVDLLPDAAAAAAVAQLEDVPADASQDLSSMHDESPMAVDETGMGAGLVDGGVDGIVEGNGGANVPPAKIGPNTPFASTSSAKTKAKTKREPKPEPAWDPAVKQHWAFRSSVCEAWLPVKKGAGRTSRVCESCSKVVNALRRRAKNLMELQQKRHKEGVHVETLRHDFIARDPELALSHLQRQTTLINKLRREARAARQSNLLLEQERRVTSFKVATLQQTLIDVQKNANENPQKQLARHLREAVPLLKHAFPEDNPDSMDMESRAFFTSAFNNIAKLADGSSRNGFRYSIEVIKTAKHYIHKLGKNYYKRLAQTILWPSKRHVQIFISKERQREGEEEKAQDIADREREQSATDGMLSMGSSAQAKDGSPGDLGAAKATGAKGGRGGASGRGGRKGAGGRGGGGARPAPAAAARLPAGEAEAKSAGQDIVHDALSYPGQAEHAHLTAAASVAAGAAGSVVDPMMANLPGAFAPQGMQMGMASPSSAAAQPAAFNFGPYAAFANSPWIFQNGLPGGEPEPQPRPNQGPTRSRGV